MNKNQSQQDSTPNPAANPASATSATSTAETTTASTTEPKHKNPTNKTPPQGRATFKQLLPLIFERRGLLTLALAISVIAAAASLAQAPLVGVIIQRVQAGETVTGVGIALTAIVTLYALAMGAQHYTLQRMGEGVVLTSRKRLIAQILHLPISEFDSREAGDLTSRIGSDTTLLRAVLTQGLVEVVGGLLVMFGSLVGMLIIDAVLFAVTFGVLAVSVVSVVVVSGKIRPAMQAAQKQLGELSAQVTRGVQAIRTIRANGAEEREQRELEDKAQKTYLLGLRVARISAYIVPISFLAVQLTFLAVLGIGGFRVASGATEIAQLVTFLILLFMLLPILGQAFGAISSVNQALGALGRIQEILGLETERARDAVGGVDVALVVPAVVDGSADVAVSGVQSVSVGQGVVSGAAETAPVAAGGGVSALRFCDVHFAYASVSVRGEGRPASEEGFFAGFSGRRGVVRPAPRETVVTPVLHGVSFDVPRGSRVALVGPSGSGKSTVLALIERFYDPTAGCIELGGVDLRGLDRRWLRSQLGYVEQDAPALSGTLRDNLVLGCPDAGDDECVRVLEKVNLGGLLVRGGVDALGQQIGERGVTLSGGEKQRLALARALLAAPPILLLDESTASLDSVNEQLMREAIDSLASDRTVVIVAHRLSTVVDSDKIVVLKEGVVVGEGTHEQLLVSTPLYRELAEHQLLL